MLLKKVRTEDIPHLSQFCQAIYPHYFRDYWTPEGLQWYLEKEYSIDRLTSDLANSSIAYYYIRQRDAPVGFVKVKWNVSSEAFGSQVFELEKIYLKPGQGSQGLGAVVLQEIIHIARQKQHTILFLYVLDTNLKAIAFYEKQGFRFHHKIRLNLPHFKDELRGLDCLYLNLTS